LPAGRWFLWVETWCLMLRFVGEPGWASTDRIQRARIGSSLRGSVSERLGGPHAHVSKEGGALRFPRFTPSASWRPEWWFEAELWWRRGRQVTRHVHIDRGTARRTSRSEDPPADPRIRTPTPSSTRSGPWVAICPALVSDLFHATTPDASSPADSAPRSDPRPESPTPPHPPTHCSPSAARGSLICPHPAASTFRARLESASPSPVDQRTSSYRLPTLTSPSNPEIS